MLYEEMGPMGPGELLHSTSDSMIRSRYRNITSRPPLAITSLPIQ